MSNEVIRALYADAGKQAVATRDEQRHLVLRHEDLAARLTMPPLDYKTPQQWNGYIPPFMVLAADRYVRNGSPQRVHLIAIVRQAMERTYGPAAARAWLEEQNTDHWTRMPPSSYERAMQHRAARNWNPHHAIEGDRP
jgi:hypothetical protein